MLALLGELDPTQCRQRPGAGCEPAPRHAGFGQPAMAPQQPRQLNSGQRHVRIHVAAGVTAAGGDVDADVALATVELARLLRRHGRLTEAGVAWSRLATGPGPLAALGWIELAKEREHRDRDAESAWAATDEALMALYRSRGHGSIALRRSLEADLGSRRARLARRLTKQTA